MKDFKKILCSIFVISADFAGELVFDGI